MTYGTSASNQTMKPTAPLRYNPSVLATTPAVAYLFLVRRPAFCVADVSG